MRRRWRVATSTVGAAILLAGAVSPAPLSRVQSPGAPGGDSVWDSGAKQGLGTSTTTASKLWYTLGDGITDEVYYPQADTPDAHDLQYLVTDGATFTDQEKT